MLWLLNHLSQIVQQSQHYLFGTVYSRRNVVFWLSFYSTIMALENGCSKLRALVTTHTAILLFFVFLYESRMDRPTHQLPAHLSPPAQLPIFLRISVPTTRSREIPYWPLVLYSQSHRDYALSLWIRWSIVKKLRRGSAGVPTRSTTVPPKPQATGEPRKRYNLRAL